MICEIQLLKQLISAKMNCALIYFMSNHYRRKCLSDVLHVMICLKWFQTNWKIVMIWEIQLLMISDSAMQRKWFVH